MSLPVIQCGKAINVTATGNVAGATGQTIKVIGFYVNSTSSGTMIFRQGGSGGSVLNAALTPAAGGFHPWPAEIDGPLHVTVGGTIDVTFFVTA